MTKLYSYLHRWTWARTWKRSRRIRTSCDASSRCSRRSRPRRCAGETWPRRLARDPRWSSEITKITSHSSWPRVWLWWGSILINTVVVNTKHGRLIPVMRNRNRFLVPVPVKNRNRFLAGTGFGIENWNRSLTILVNDRLMTGYKTG